MKRFSIILALVALLTGIGLVGRCLYDRHLRHLDAEVMQIGAEDVMRRVSEAKANLADITSLYEEAALAKARSLARIVAGDPSVLSEQPRFEALAKVLDVDELHVSDSNGVLIASFPASSAGYRMGSSAQSAAFLPAITDSRFELVQEPMRKGIDNRLFQYAGVARVDRPGIVQVGFYPGRLAAAQSIADIRKIAETSHIGGGGKVAIFPIRDRGTDEVLMTSSVGRPDENGYRDTSLEIIYGNHLILITMPLRGWRLADDGPFSVLLAVVVVLFILLLFCCIYKFVRGGGAVFSESLRLMFGSDARSSGPEESKSTRRIVLYALLVFFLCSAGAWFVADRRAKAYAGAVLTQSVTEVTDDVMECVDDLLFYVGNAIVRHYRTPQTMTQDTVNEVMHRYNIDELNIVDERGVILKGALADIGFDFHSTSNTLPFCRLLQGVETYSQPFRAAIEDPTIVRKYAGVAFPERRGFVQLGFDKKRLDGDIDYRLCRLLQGWTIGGCGYAILARRATGEIVSCGSDAWSGIPRGAEAETLGGIGFSVLDIPSDPKKLFVETLYGEKCYCLSAFVGDYHRLVVAIPKAEIDRERNITVAIAGGILFLVLLLSILILTWFSKSNARLRVFIAEDKIKREKELAVSALIQTSTLPVVPADTEYAGSIYPEMHTAREVGGDFYDFYRLPSGRLFLLIADVSGKGISAAMFMMQAKAIIKACASSCATVAEAMTEANHRLAEKNDAEMFVTVWACAIDTATGEMEFVNCGHNPPLLKHGDGSVEWIRTRPCLALAAMDGIRYRAETMKISPRDSLFLYTDGLTEAMNAAGELYGEDRLEKAFAEGGSLWVGSVVADIRAFVNGAEQSDDMTLLAYDYGFNPQKENTHGHE